MPKGVYLKTKEHIEKLKPHLLRNLKELGRCEICGRIKGSRKHQCPTKEERQEGAKHLQTKEAREKRIKTLKENYSLGKVIPFWLGKKRDRKTKEKIREAKLKNPTRYWLGKKMSKKVRESMSKSHIGVNAGDKHYKWSGGITNEVKKRWCSLDYQKWRKRVFERDNYTCKKCGIKSIKGLGKTIILNAHHIKSIYKYPKLIFKVNNGKTLCLECHLKYHKRYGFK